MKPQTPAITGHIVDNEGRIEVAIVSVYFSPEGWKPGDQKTQEY